MNKEMQKALETDGEKLRQITDKNHGPFFLEENDETDYQNELPKYSDPGRMLVTIWGPCQTRVYKYEYEVFDYDQDSCVWWINEGEGFDYWLSNEIEFPGLGTFVIEGIIGQYHKGNWSYGEDDNVSWDHTKIRLATRREIRTGTLQEPFS